MQPTYSRNDDRYTGPVRSDSRMKFFALTIFPELFSAYIEHGIIRRAIERNIISFRAVNLRDFTTDRHQVTDDRPYGGGSGMVMKPEPLAAAIRAVKEIDPAAATVLLTPQGKVFNQEIARYLTSLSGLIFICGRYEGVDERICGGYVDFDISIGDFVLTGGELAAMSIIDAVTRLLPGALGGQDAAEKDSFSDHLLEHAQFTRPRQFEGAEPPAVLLSGHHEKIEKWRLESALIRTFLNRKDLLENRSLSRRELDIMRKWCTDIERIVQTQSPSGTGSLSGEQ